MSAAWDIVISGLTITSSWGNGHATTYRALATALAADGHRVRFLECDRPWYREHRDLTALPGVEIALYDTAEEFADRFAPALRAADLALVGSYVPDGLAIGRTVQRCARGITAFYDIDTPVTLAALERGDCAYLAPGMIADFDLYLSFTGGPALQLLERHYGSPAARALYCSVDPQMHAPMAIEPVWDLGYLGTYSADRQPALAELLVRPAQALPAGRFIVAGPQYPADIVWPGNVARREHLPPADHGAFYAAQRFTLNVTRADMVRMGWSPSVRLFEAAACAVPVISDDWAGLDTLFSPGRDILIARDGGAVREALSTLTERERVAIGRRARTRVLSRHTARHRAAELIAFAESVAGRRARGRSDGAARPRAQA